MRSYFFVFLCSLLSIYASLNAQTLVLESNSDTTQLFIHIELEGQKHKMLIDNGALKTILFLTATERSHFKKVSESKVIDPYNRESSIYIIRKATLKIPEIDFQFKGSFASLEDKPITLEENNVDGILGLDILSQLNYTIHFKTLEFSTLAPITLQNKDDWFPLPMIYGADQLQAVEVESFNNKKLLQRDTFVIDLGYNQVACRPQTSKPKDVKALKLAFTETVLGMKVDRSSFESADIQICPMQVKNLPMSSSKAMESKLLGFRFFKAFGEVYFEGNSQTLWLKKTKTFSFSFEGEKVFKNRIVAQFIAIEDIDFPRSSIGSKVDDNYFPSKHKIIWPLTTFSEK